MKEILFVLIAVLSLFGFECFAQESGVSLKGIVTDTIGSVVPDTEVTVKSLIDSAVLSTKTNEGGEFSFQSLPAGKYEVKVVWMKLSNEPNQIVSLPETKEIEVKLVLPVACREAGKEKIVLTEQDKAEIVNKTLVYALRDERGLISAKEKEKELILSTKNIKPDWITDTAKWKIKLLTQNQVQRKADNEGDFLYMSFRELNVKGGCVVVDFDYTWAVGKNSGFGYLSGGGFTMEFRKQAGSWIGSYVIGWVS